MSREVHPAAAVWPLLADDELQALADDIATNGLLDPITIDADGRVVDGRNRLAACQLAGIEPHYVILDNDAVVHALINARNGARRHMTTGARAMAVALTLDTAGLRENGRWKKGVITVTNSENSQSSAWPKAMADAGAILDHAPDLADAVVTGGVSLHDAHKTAKRRKEDAQSAEAKLTKLAADHPDLAAKVRADELTLEGAIAEGRERVQQWNLTMRGGEEAARRITDDLALDVSAVVIATLAPRNTTAEWATPADLDLPALIDCVLKALDQLEDCR